MIGKSESKKIRKYRITQFILDCLFIGGLLSTGVVVWKIITNGIVVESLVLLIALLAVFYAGGAASGYVSRKIGELGEEHSDE